jgi:hypothetical protein
MTKTARAALAPRIVLSFIEAVPKPHLRPDGRTVSHFKMLTTSLIRYSPFIVRHVNDSLLSSFLIDLFCGLLVLVFHDIRRQQ